MHAATIVSAMWAAFAQSAYMQAAPIQTVPKPFFTDDLAGWLKLGGMYVAALGAIGVLMVRLAYNAHTEKIKTLTTDVDGVGRKAETNALEVAANAAALGQLTGRVNVIDHKVDVHQRELGEHDAQLKAYEKTQHQLQSDIMDAIRTSGEVVRNELHALNVKVARFEERERFGEAMAEVAGALRMMAKTRQGDG